MSTALVTGASSGVGLELTKKLLHEGWSVAALVRSDVPDEPALRAARDEDRLRVYRADLSDFASLGAAIERLRASEDHLDVLFNNAGVAASELTFSPQGRELQFEVNTVVPYLLAKELRGLLARGALKTIVNTSSNAALTVRRIDVSTLERPTHFRKLFGAYASSKLALSLWTHEIAPELAAEGLEIRSVCPGANKTPMSGGPGMPFWLMPVQSLFFAHPRKGAARVHDAALGAHRGATGIFVVKGKATPVPFAAQGRAVLDRVDTIHRRELASSSA